MSYDAREKSSPQHSYRTATGTGSSIAPSKQTKTMRLPPRVSGAAEPIQMKSDSAMEAKRAEYVAITEQWIEVAMRPDLYGAPVPLKSVGTGQEQATSLSASGSGQRMPEAVQAKMENALGAEFSAVRIHEGLQATALEAQPYTQDTDIHFAPGQYDPSSQRGQELLGHELTHVVQRLRRRVQAKTPAKGMGVNEDAALEKEANEKGSRAARSTQISSGRAEVGWKKGLSDVARGGIVQMQPETNGPRPNMSDRHILAILNFWKGTQSGNSYLVNPINGADLSHLYKEALSHGIKHGNVTLANGQTWFIQQASGKFHPVSGPGIINLTQQEVSFMRMLVRQVRSGGVNAQAALQNLSKAMGGQGYSVSPHMEIALDAAGTKLGFSRAQYLKALAPNAPKTKPFNPPAELQSAAKAKAGARAFRLLKWGGRIFLVIAAAADVYEVYEADNRPKTITKKTGAWLGATAAGGAAAAEASPLLAGGLGGWIGYGVVVGGAGILGYIAGGEVTETIYEWALE